jgi:tripartite-type tricarboxylate transporter receptor subunit TctC
MMGKPAGNLAAAESKEEMMNPVKQIAMAAVIASALVAVAAAPAQAALSAEKDPGNPGQGYPNRPIRLIAPFVPGGPTDIVARLVGQKLGENLGQTVVVDNRGGAGGAVGMEIAAKSAPDGYTLVLGSSGNLVVNPALNPNLPYDVLKDFQPITQTTAGPQIMVVHPSVPAKSVQEFIALAKARPGQFNYASGGTGTTTHLAAELFKMSAGISIEHVPYKGTGQALTDLIGGRVQMMMSSMLPAIPHVRAGRLRGLAVTSARRAAVLPEMPTMAESGLPGFETTSWHGMLVPAKTPKPITMRLHAEMVKTLNQPDVKERFASQGMDTVGSTPEQFAAYMRSETKKWAKVIKQLGIRPE